jgi:hypothetical protein
MVSQILANASEPTFHLRHTLSTVGSDSVRRAHKCCVYIAGSSKYCARLNSIQAYNDINRDVSFFVLSWLFTKHLILLYIFLRAQLCLLGLYSFFNVTGDRRS